MGRSPDGVVTKASQILGISAYYHDSAAALLKDGELVAAVQQERFTRKKHDAGDLELDPLDQAMSGNSNLSLSESGSAATPKSDCQNLQTLVTQFFK